MHLGAVVSDAPSALSTPRTRMQGRACCDWVTLCARHAGRVRRNFGPCYGSGEHTLCRLLRRSTKLAAPPESGLRLRPTLSTLPRLCAGTYQKSAKSKPSQPAAEAVPSAWWLFPPCKDLAAPCQRTSGAMLRTHHTTPVTRGTRTPSHLKL